MLAFFTFSLTFAVSLTLGADVVAKHSSKDEVLFGRKLIQRTGDKQTDGIEALLATKIDVDILLASGLHHVVDSRYYLINDSKRFPEVHIILCHNSPLPAESFQSCFYISHHVLVLLVRLSKLREYLVRTFLNCFALLMPMTFIAECPRQTSMIILIR